MHSCFQEETRKMQSASRKEIPFGLQAVYSDTAGNKLVNPAFADLMHSFRRWADVIFSVSSGNREEILIILLILSNFIN